MCLFGESIELILNTLANPQVHGDVPIAQFIASAQSLPDSWRHSSARRSSTTIQGDCAVKQRFVRWSEAAAFVPTGSSFWWLFLACWLLGSVVAPIRAV